MCGIFAIIGEQPCAQDLLRGLKRLEYRGYDSAGIATKTNGSNQLHVKKSPGKVSSLEPLDLPGNIGIAHTRWATHGAPSEKNAHPHLDQDHHYAIIHNGIIENHQVLREFLQEKGYKFQSETDSEVLVHLIAYYDAGNLLKAVQEAISKVKGAYGLVVLSTLHDKLIAVRKGSPLVIGVDDHRQYLASDPSAIIDHTREIIYLEDGDCAVLTANTREIISSEGDVKDCEVNHVDWELEALEKGGYDHFMLKEIYEQPQSIKQTISGRANKLRQSGRVLDHHFDVPERIIITACGTSWHAGLVARHYFEFLSGIAAQVEYASELRYSQNRVRQGDLVIAISQSGETADTLEAIRMCKEKGAKLLGVVNVVGSTIAREVEGGLYLHAGPEVGVASTKAFTTQLVALLLIACEFALRSNKLSQEQLEKILVELERLPELVTQTLKVHDHIKKFAPKYANSTNALYLGRGGTHYPVALEGALKLKEISYIHAEGLPAAEMKHGPIALIDNDMPVIILAPQGYLYDKVLSNAQEVHARGGRVIMISTGTDHQIERLTDDIIIIPEVKHLLQPIISTIPLQLLAYELALLKGCDVDKPRNLAKSVTVE